MTVKILLTFTEPTPMTKKVKPRTSWMKYLDRLRGAVKKQPRKRRK